MPLDERPAETVAAYLAATRIHRQHHGAPSSYPALFSLFEELAARHGVPLSIELCFSLSRAPEMLTVGDRRVLVYDQYLGQSLALLNRIHAERQGRQSVIVYAHKVLGEYLRRRSRLSEALVCGLLYSQMRDCLLSRGTADETRTIRTLVQETFVLAHEIFHSLLEADPGLRGRTEAKVAKFARDQDRKREMLYADGTGQRAFELFQSSGLGVWLDEEKPGDFFAQSQRETAWSERLEASPSLVEEMCCDLHAVNTTAAVVGSLVPIDAADIAKAIVLGHYHLRLFRALESAAEWFVRRLEQGQPFLTPSDPPPPEVWGGDHVADLSIRTHHLLFCCSLYWLQRGGGSGQLSEEGLFGPQGTYTQLEHLREGYHTELYDFVEAVRQSAMFGGRLAEELARRREDEGFRTLEDSVLAEARSGVPTMLDRLLGFEQVLGENPLLLRR